jgi:hypothetical protein
MDTETTITRAQVEKALWELAGFRGDAIVTDGVMIVIDAYAAAMQAALSGTSGEMRESYLHVLVQLAEHILDAGGQRLAVQQQLRDRQAEIQDRQAQILEQQAGTQNQLQAAMDALAGALTGLPAGNWAGYPVAKPKKKGPLPGNFFNADGTITCRGCGTAKPPEQFHKDLRAPQTGRKSKCAQCYQDARAAA